MEADAGGVMRIPGNRFLKEAGIEDSAEKAATYLDSLIPDESATPGASRQPPAASRQRRLSCLREAPRMVGFLVESCIALRRIGYWPDYNDERPKCSWAGRYAMFRVGLHVALASLTGKQWVTSGAALLGRMVQACPKAGVEFRLDAPVSERVVENGAAQSQGRHADRGQTRSAGEFDRRPSRRRFKAVRC